jgi:DNA-binding MarR family transcriptional regulator
MSELPAGLPGLPCMCARLRRASRVLTQLYEEALRPTGLRATQFTLLQALSLAGEVTQGDLGRMLAIDSTTLTRTLEIMSRHGWIAERRGEDRRERWVRLSRGGHDQLQRALPFWEKAQAHVARQLGNKRWRELRAVTDAVTGLVTKESGESL